MNLNLERNQIVTTAFYDAVQTEAVDALRFMPAEDKINLALTLTKAPKIDDPKHINNTMQTLQAALQQAQATIQALQTQSSGSGTTTTP